MFRSQRRSGFTLIELLVLIVIIAVMSSTIVPAYSRYLAHARFDGQVRSIQEIAAYAHEQAVATDSTVTMTYDPQSATFTVVTPPVSHSDLPIALAGVDSSLNDISYPPRRLQISPEYALRQSAGDSRSGSSGSSTNIRFRGDGTCDGAMITLSSASGYTAQLTLQASTSRLLLQPDAAPGQVQ